MGPTRSWLQSMDIFLDESQLKMIRSYMLRNALKDATYTWVDWQCINCPDISQFPVSAWQMRRQTTHQIIPLKSTLHSWARHEIRSVLPHSWSPACTWWRHSSFDDVGSSPCPPRQGPPTVRRMECRHTADARYPAACYWRSSLDESDVTNCWPATRHLIRLSLELWT